MSEISLNSTSSSILVIYWPFNVSHFGVYKKKLTLVLIHISLIINNIVNLFKYLLAMWNCPILWNAFSSVLSISSLLDSFSFSNIRSSYILWIWRFSQLHTYMCIYMYAKYLLPVCDLCFHFLRHRFNEYKVLNLNYIAMYLYNGCSF